MSRRRGCIFATLPLLNLAIPGTQKENILVQSGWQKSQWHRETQVHTVYSRLQKGNTPSFSAQWRIDVEVLNMNKKETDTIIVKRSEASSIFEP